MHRRGRDIFKGAKKGFLKVRGGICFTGWNLTAKNTFRDVEIMI